MQNLANRLWNMPVLLFSGALLCWAGNAVFTRLTMVNIDVTPIQLSFWRTLFGFLIISVLAWSQVRRDWNIIWRHWAVLAFLGITSLVAYNLLLYFGLSSGEEAPAAATINSLFPLVIIAVSVLVFKESISAWGWFGIALAVMGGLMAAFEGSIDKAMAFELSVGKIWILGAVFGYGIYMACVRLRPEGIGQYSFLWALLFWALLLLTALWGWDGVARQSPFPWHEPGAVVHLTYLVLAPTLAAPILVNQAIKMGGARTPALMMNLMPFVVAALAAIVSLVTDLNESLQWYHWVSLALIIPGTLLIQMKQ